MKDGTYGNATEDDDGVLRSESGVVVALKDDGTPMTQADMTKHGEAAKAATVDEAVKIEEEGTADETAKAAPAAKPAAPAPKTE
jgi:hypothetical protein